MNISKANPKISLHRFQDPQAKTKHISTLYKPRPTVGMPNGINFDWQHRSLKKPAKLSKSFSCFCYQEYERTNEVYVSPSNVISR